MPYIENKIGKKVTESKIIELKTSLIKIIKKETGKSENSIMINIEDDKKMFLGNKKEEVAYIEIKLLGKLQVQQKDSLSYKIGKIYEDILDIGLDKSYITFFELQRQDWGFKGETFAKKK